MNVSCPACQRLVARSDKRRKNEQQAGWLRSVKGSKVRAIPGLAPRITCPCGHTVILLKGSV